MIRTFLYKPSGNLILLTIVWVLAMILTDPLHNFPLNDDWSYSLSVQHLVEEGQLFFTNWLGSPLITQVFWGTLFCLPLGFSFEALTISTLVIAWVGTIFSYLTLYLVTRNKFLSFWCSLLFLFNPLFYSLSVTFMMDVPFYAFFIISFYYFLLHTKSHKIYYLVLGVLFSVLSTLIRQFGIVIPLAFLVYSLIKNKFLSRQVILQYILGFIVVAGSFWLYSRWFENSGWVSENYRRVSDLFNTSISSLGWRIFTRTGLILMELGFWLFPLLIFLIKVKFQQVKKNIKVLIIPVIVLIFPMIRMYIPFPVGNIFYDLGLGPVTTTDTFIHGLNKDLFANPWVFHFIRPLAFAGGMMIVILLSLKIIQWFRGSSTHKTEGNKFMESTGIIAAILAMFYIGIIMINFTFFDRYLIPFLIILPLIVFPENISKSKPKPVFKSILFLFVSMLIFFSITGTRNYLEWNRVRWSAANELIENGVPPQKIDGGHEFNGWYGTYINREGKWETEGFDYAIVFSEMEGYEKIKKYDVFNDITRSEYSLYVLKRLD